MEPNRKVRKQGLEHFIKFVRELPCPSPQVAIGALWHRRLENQPANRWLRELVAAVCKRL